MKTNRSCTIDDIALYMGRGCELHPLLYDQYHSELATLSATGKVTLIPFTILEQFHRRIGKVA